MKQRILMMGLILCILLQVPAQAAITRGTGFTPTLSFDGTTANCSIYVRGSSPADKISVTLELKHGNTCIGYWEESSTYFAVINGDATVVKGQFYELIATVSINGELQASVPASGTCRQEALFKQF